MEYNEKQIKFDNVKVGYGKKIVVSNIDIEFMKGKMTCLLGSNGAGKTTILKSIARLIHHLSGDIMLNNIDIKKYKSGNFSKKVAAILTERLVLENMTGFEVASMGRYPHTGILGGLSQSDKDFVDEMILICDAENLRDKQFNQMSDGEKQKILIARGLSQDPDVLLLDEPTSHLDIKYKLDVLSHLKHLCVTKNKTIICTLHEPDLAIKCADYLVLVKNDYILAAGETDAITNLGLLNTLYNLKDDQFNNTIGMIEFAASKDKKVFIIGTDGQTASIMRKLTRSEIGFGIGVLHNNDSCYHIAKAMGANTIVENAYTEISTQNIELAIDTAKNYNEIILSEFNVCDINIGNKIIADKLVSTQKKVITSREYMKEKI